MMHRKLNRGTARALCMLLLVATAFTARAQQEQQPAPSSESAQPATSSPDASAPVQDSTQPAAPDTQPAPAEAAQPQPSAPAEAAQPQPYSQTVPVAAHEEPPPAAASSEGPTKLEDVVVTATKRAKSARDIPTTVDAISGDKLVQEGKTQLDEIVRESPSVVKDGSRVVIRAVATTAVASFITSEEVGRFFADTSLNAPSVRGGLADYHPFDLANVEILKGPQATLFGGTALSGAIRYVPNEPDLNHFTGSARVGIAEVAHSGDWQKEASVMLNGAFFDSLGVRVVGTGFWRAGAIDDLRSGKQDVDRHTLRQFRAMGKWKPTDRITLNLTMLDWHDKGEWAFTDQPDKWETSSKTMPEPIELKTRLYIGRFEYAFDAFSVVGVASYLKNSLYWVLDLAPLLGTSAVPAQTPDIVDTFAKEPTYEVRLLSNHPSQSDWWIFDQWEYLGGFFLMRAKQQATQAVVGNVPLPVPLPIPGLIGGLSPGVNDLGVAYTDVDETAFFFDTTKAMFDKRLEVNLGGRLAKTHLNILAYTTVQDPSNPQVEPVMVEKDDHRFNPKGALTWHFNKNLAIRASAAQGFRFGGANSNATRPVEMIPATFDSDSLWNYEVGIRSDWFDRTLRFDVTGFRINWTRMQVTQVTSLGQNYVTNVGGSRILGVEGQLLWRLPTDWPMVPAGLTFAAGGSYIDARTTEFFNSQHGAAPVGTRLPLTPYVLANTSLSWSRNFGSWLVTTSVSDSYSGGRKNELVESVHLPAYSQLGAVLRLAKFGWYCNPAISVTGINLLDKAAPNFAFPATTGTGEVAYVLNRPRTLMLNLEASF